MRSIFAFLIYLVCDLQNLYAGNVERSIEKLTAEELEMCDGFFSNRKRPKGQRFERPKHKREDRGPKTEEGDEKYFRPLSPYHIEVLIKKYPEYHPHNLKDMGHSHQDLFFDNRTGEIVIRAKNRSGESEAVGIFLRDLYH